MRPVKIQFQAFGPYAGQETIDFEDLSSKGLFLICGKTGIGKTMIIDAMTFALFGKSSGKGRDDFEAMRCTRADFNAPTIVSFIFEHNDRYYRFERRLVRKTKNLSLEMDASIRDENGVWSTLIEKTTISKVNAKAEEILGLSYEQFRQVIVLPQGQFEELLTSNSDQKEEILTSLFGVDKWQKISEHLFDEAIARKKELIGIKEKIEASLGEESCETIEELRAGIGSRYGQLEDMQKEYERTGYDKRIAELQELLKVTGRLSDLRDNLENREKEEIKAIEDVAKKEEKAVSADRELKAHLEKADEIEKASERKIIFEGKRDHYLGIDAAVEELESLKKRKTAFENETSQAEEVFKDQSEEVDEAKKEYGELTRAHKGLIDAYVAGIKGELAKELEDGQPCPVCGSKDHPQKAEISAESVSKEDVERKKEEAESKYREMDAAMERQEKAKADLENMKTALSDMVSKVKVSEAKLEELKKNLVEGIDTAEELEEEIERLATVLSSYEKKKNTLESSDKEAKEELSLAKEKVKTAGIEKEAAERALEEALSEMEDRDIKPEADIQTELDEYLRIVKEHSRQTGVLKEDIRRLETKADNLEKEGKDLDEKIRQAEADVAFGRRLRGETGTSLQRYVLGIMFSSVIVEANRMLEMVHGGRYRLFRTDKSGKGRKAGLELKVHDRNSEEHEGRFVGTLSGGEKFLAALALSIGMANVARKNGMGMEALFIDEGFGTLDEESIGDAMSILARIQESKGVVGLISHMQILRDNITTKLRVEEDSSGSHIVMDVG